MPRKPKQYLLAIDHSIHLVGTKAKLESIQRALIGAEQVEHRSLLNYDHPGYDYRDPGNYIVEDGLVSTHLRPLKEPILTDDEFKVVRRAAEQDWEEQNAPAQEPLGLPEPRKGLPAPLIELPAPKDT